MQETTIRTLTSHSTYAKGYESRLLNLIMQDPDRFVDTDSRIIKHDGTTTVALLQKDAAQWVIKRYNTKNLWHALRRPFRRSRAENCWQMSKLCAQAKISIPTPIAYIEKRFGPLRGRSYFINEFVQADNLLTHLTKHGAAVAEITEKKVIKLFEALRSAGIVHGDMKATNILVSNKKLFLLDLDACTKSGNQVVFEQGCRKDRARFLQNWENHPDLYQRFRSALCS